MKKFLLRIIETFVKPLYGKKKYQSFFGVLLNISLRGLNYRNSDIDENGEGFLVDKLTEYYKSDSSEKILIFDIGANVGNYTKVLFDKFNSKKINFRIFSFEPLPAAFQKLKERFKNNDLIEVVNSGFGKNNETLNIYSNNETSELASLYKKDKDFNYEGIVLNIATQVNIRNLDNFCKENNIDKIHFIKIDVEGSEYDVIKNSPHVIKNSDFIQFEFGTSNVDSRTYLKDFFEELNNDFKIYRILKDGVLNINEYNPDYEISVLCNYLAVSKKINNFNG